MPSETPGEHLLRALRVTTSARFSAGHRLKRHETFSLWSISFSSLFLIVISLLRPFGIPLRYSNAIVDLSQVVASAVILVVSLLVNGSKFAERAEKMHRCGLELNALTREVELALQDTTSGESVTDLQHRYDEMLSKYENHSNIDYKMAQIRRAPEYYGIHWWHKICRNIEAVLGLVPTSFFWVGSLSFYMPLSGHELPGEYNQHLTRHWSRRPTAYASLQLPGAAHRQR